MRVLERPPKLRPITFRVALAAGIGSVFELCGERQTAVGEGAQLRVGTNLLRDERGGDQNGFPATLGTQKTSKKGCQGRRRKILVIFLEFSIVEETELYCYNKS